MKNTLFKKFLSSGVQAISVQVIGGVFFFIIAKYLTKDSVGLYQWLNGIALALTMLLSYGMDQVVLRRIAATDRSDWAAAAYLFQVFAGSCIVFAMLFVMRFIPAITNKEQVQYMALIFLSQAILFMGNPLKQLLNAKQLFAPYAIISTISNAGKLVVAYWLIRNRTIDLPAVIYTLIGTAVFEFIALLGYALYAGQFSFYFKRVAYTKLLKEATPQFIAVLFDAVLARADVILVGIMCAEVVVAEYSFAYRIYEIAKLPITVVSPILLARFAPMLNTGNKLDTDKKNLLQSLLNIELFLAMMIPLVLCIIWSPLLDYVYDKKFGTSNHLQFLLLAVAIPFHFYINLLWNLGFAAKKTKELSRIMAATAIVNIVLNIILIPMYGGVGASIAYLVTTVALLILCLRLIEKHLMTFSSISFVMLLISVSVAYFAAAMSSANVVLQLLIGLGIYLVLSVITKQLKKDYVSIIKGFLKK